MSRCPTCGEENKEGARFCSGCGDPLRDPPGLAREVRKVVTVVFTDVTGSTALGEQLDPESLRRVMALYFAETRSVIERHGGTVEKFIGDAVMAVFGIPVLHEDDALRAVRAAAELREALGRLNDELGRDHGVAIAVRTGVNTGEVVAGDSSHRQTFATGDAVNVAARLEQAAGPGEILIGPQTYRLVRDAVLAERIDPLALKGKGEPVAAYRLESVVPGAPGSARRLSALVGRESELRLLRDAFDRAVRDRACHLFTLLGAAGVGKSRLTDEFLASLAGRARVLSGRCLSYGDGITFWPLVEIVTNAAGLGDDSPAEAERKIAELLAGQDDAALIAERVAQVIGLVDTTAATEENFRAIRKLFEGISRRRPLVVLFDDVHWAEPTFLDLIEDLADWSRDAPILLLCLARPELLDARRGWGGDKFNATSVLLEPLRDDDCRTLIDNLLGAVQLEENAGARITQAAEGNPLFVEEMLAMLIDDGILVRSEDTWTVRGDVSSVAVPPTIQALLAARLDRLGGEERIVLESASVEGKLFHRGAVAELVPDELRPQVGSHLMMLMRKELIRPDRAEFGGEDAFRFRHLLIRDAAYESMPKEGRATLHERLARWLERTVGERAGEYEEILGYHLEQAYRCRVDLGPVDQAGRELGARAGTQLASAGRRAFRRGDLAAAQTLLARALDLLPREDPRRSEILCGLGQSLAEGGQFERAEAAFSGAIETARARGDALSLAHAELTRLGALQRVRTDISAEDVERAVRHAFPVFERAGDDVGLAIGWDLLASANWYRCRAGATAEAARRGTAHAERLGDRLLAHRMDQWTAFATYYGPTPVLEGLRRFERVLAGSNRDPVVQGNALNALAGLEPMRGRFDVARRHLARLVELWEDLGLRVLAAAVRSHVGGHIEMLAGDPAAAEREGRAGFEDLERMGEKAYLSSTAGRLANAIYVQGRDDEAERYTRIGEEAAGER